MLPVFNSIDSSIVSDIKAAGASFNPNSFNYTSGGNTYDLDREAIQGVLKALRATAGSAKEKVNLTQNVFDAIKNGTENSPDYPGSHPVFVIGSERREIVLTGSSGSWGSDVAVSAYEIDQAILTDITQNGAVYKSSIKGYKVGSTQYTIKRASLSTNYKIVRHTGVATSDRIYMTKEMFDVVKNYTFIPTSSLPPNPCNHPLFEDANGLRVSLAYTWASAAPYNALVIRHNGP